MEINAEYLIAIGDAYAHLGNKAEARKQYEAYLADPLSLPASAARVKAKIAALATPAGAAMALELPMPADVTGKQALAAQPLPPIALPAPPPAKNGEVALALPELPDVAALPASGDAGKKSVAAPAGPAQTAAATAPAVAKTPPAPSTSRAPSEAITAVETQRPTPTSRRGAQRAVAWVAAGVAVAALGGGALAYSKASSAQSDLTGRVHSGAEAQSLLEQEKQNRTLGLVGLAGGLVAAGLAVALFTF
jgi:hypothetical protein